MHRDGVLADDTIEHWVNSYDLRQKVRCLPEVVPSLDTPKVAVHLQKSTAWQLKSDPRTRSVDSSSIHMSVQSAFKMVPRPCRIG
jgi:hypothetical protein